MDMNGMKMVTASRRYQKGETQSLTAQVGLMPAAMAAPVQAMNLNMETDESIVKTATVDGFTVHHNHEKAQNSGAVMVFLGGANQASSALFTLEYDGISAQDAMALAKRFDWKKMQAATAALR
ncbi:hypothetical protein [Methylogaea oryzae]|nr:hypothetical protein [Methylogaea oryzae]